MYSKSPKGQAALDMWNDYGEEVFSNEDIPDWVSSRIKTDMTLNYFLRSSLVVLKSKNGPRKCFCVVNGIMYFNKLGMRKIIDYFQHIGYVSEEEAEMWKGEMGLKDD